MYNANDIRNVRFSKQMNGYKQEDVDIFLDSVEEDYKQFDAKLSELNAQVLSLKKENDDLKISQSGLQNVLVSAQKLADQIVADAKKTAEEIIVEAKVRAGEITSSVEEKAAADKLVAEQNKQRAAAEYAEIMKKTAEKSQEMISAAHDSVARQQLLFDKLKLDIVNFKSQVMAIYKEHIDSLSKLPDEVPFDSTRAAEAAAFAFDSKPDFTKQEEPKVEEIAEEPVIEETPVTEEVTEQETPDAVVEPEVSFSGFKIQADAVAEEETEEDFDDEDEEDDKPSRGFFRRKDRR